MCSKSHVVLSTVSQGDTHNVARLTASDTWCFLRFPMTTNAPNLANITVRRMMRPTYVERDPTLFARQSSQLRQTTTISIDSKPTETLASAGGRRNSR